MRQVIVNDPQLFAAQISIHVGGSLVHCQMRAGFYGLVEHLRSQTQERCIAVSRGLDLRSADFACREVVGHGKHVRSGKLVLAVILNLVLR
jgi:hypothetical protein